MTVADITPETANGEQALAIWYQAERAHIEAAIATSAAVQVRMKAAKGLAARRDMKTWEVEADPEVAPLVAVEDASLRAEHAAVRALVGTPAPDWRAWAVKLDLVREYLDDVLSPLEPDARKLIRKRPKNFPGSRRFQEAHHYALGLYAGLAKADLAGRLAPLILQVCAELNRAPDASSAEDVPAFGLAMLLQDAARLAADAKKGGVA